MAGIMTPGDEGVEVKTQQVPTINALPYDKVSYAPVVASAHLGDAMRSEGVNYNTDQSIGVDLTTSPYPQGTVMEDKTPSDDVN